MLKKVLGTCATTYMLPLFDVSSPGLLIILIVICVRKIFANLLQTLQA